MPLPFAPATWIARPGSTVSATPDSTVRRPRRIVSAPASSNTGTPVTLTTRARPGPPATCDATSGGSGTSSTVWPCPHRPRQPCARPSSPAAGASVAVADPPWSPPAAVPGAGNGPAAATARGHVAALVTSNRAQPPGTASQLRAPEPRGRQRPVEHRRRPRRRRDRARSRATRSRSPARRSGRPARSTTRAACGRGRRRGRAARPPCARSPARRARTSPRSWATPAATSRCRRAVCARG